jgi:hypothetical protein
VKIPPSSTFTGDLLTVKSTQQSYNPWGEAIYKSTANTTNTNVHSELNPFISSNDNRQLLQLTEPTFDNTRKSLLFDSPASQMPFQNSNQLPTSASSQVMFRKQIKPPTFDGTTTTLSAFLQAFESASVYNEWSSVDKAAHLKACLRDIAASSLWEIADPIKDDYDQLVIILQQLFGSQGHAEKYRTELRNRKRKPNESLQTLCLDIRRLTSWAYPSASRETTDILARDNFIESLSADKLAIKIREHNPATLDEAYRLAVHLEAVRNGSTDTAADKPETHVRVVHSDANTQYSQSDTQRQLDLLSRNSLELSCQVQQLTNLVHQRLLTNTSVASPESNRFPQTAHPANRRHTYFKRLFNNSSRGHPVGNGRFNRSCFICSDSSHFARNCPHKQTRMDAYNPAGNPVYSQPTQFNGQVTQWHSANSNNSTGYPRVQPQHISDQCANQQYVSQQNASVQSPVYRVSSNLSEQSHAPVYLQGVIEAQSTLILVDSGSDISIVPLRMVMKKTITPCTTRIFAANGSPLNILGTSELSFTINNLHFRTVFFVSQEVDEVILGISWLRQESVTWNFTSDILLIRGHSVKLVHNSKRLFCRRIFVAETTMVPANTQHSVKLIAPLRTISRDDGPQLLESTGNAQGIFIPRTVFPSESIYLSTLVCNTTNESATLPQGMFVTLTEPVTYCKDSDNTSDQNDDTCQTTHVHTDRRTYNTRMLLNSGNTDNTDDCACSNNTRKQHMDDCAYSHNTRTQNANDRVKQWYESCQLPEESIPLSPIRSSPERLQQIQIIVQRVMDSLPSCISESDRKAIRQTLLEYERCFSIDQYDIGFCDLLEHDIDTKLAPPVHEPLRRQPLAYQAEIDRQVEHMLRAGVIEPSSAEWCSNVILVMKRDNSLRFAVDFRRLNAVTQVIQHPIPRVDACLDALDGASWFVTLDLRSGYWQIKQSEKDADKTTFVTRKGKFRFRRLAFGLTGAPSLFQRLVDLLMTNYTWQILLAYLDDIILYGTSVSELLSRLKLVLHRLARANLKLSPTKCAFFQQEVTFLGYKISAKGVSPDDSRIAKVATWPTPTCLKDVRVFCGMSNYYRRHIRDYSTIAEPLYNLMRQKTKFVWSQDCDRAFETLRSRLITAPILMLPSNELPIIVDTDASDTGLGAVLSMVSKNQERVVAYASRTMNATERRYSVTKREMLAVKFAVQQFRQYLIGKQFVLRVDHAPLLRMQSWKDPSPQIARWLEQLQELTFTIVHRAGSRHSNADALSRRPEEDGSCEHDSLSSNVRVDTNNRVNTNQSELTRNDRPNTFEHVNTNCDLSCFETRQPSSHDTHATVQQCRAINNLTPSKTIIRCSHLSILPRNSKQILKLLQFILHC